ncbi:MAG: hypothetical protein ACREAE_05540 [Nitrosopumilaceae archaeon]
MNSKPFFLICVLLLSITSTASYAQEEESDDEGCDKKCLEEFHIPDYDNPFITINFNKKSYTWGSQVRVIIVAPSWNEDKNKIDVIGDDEENPIKIATRGHSREPYEFVELEPNSGRFFAKFKLTGFLHDADGDGRSDLTPSTSGSGPYKGKLECDRNDAVTVSFEAAENVVVTNSAPIIWNVGEVKFDKTSYTANNMTATVIVNDPDMNLIHNRLNRVNVDVYSDSDSGGTTITAVETDVNTGIFEGHITFTEKDLSSGDRLFISEGDKIYARYTDRTVPEPYSVQDEVDIETTSSFEPAISMLNSITQDNLRIIDNGGNILNSSATENQIFVQSHLINKIDKPVQFAYIVQIRDEDGTVVNLSWMTGMMVPNQFMEASQSWIPHEKGKYAIETFVWDSVSDPMPLAPKKKTEFIVY